MTREQAIQAIQAAAQRGDPEGKRAWAYLLRGADPLAPAFVRTFGRLMAPARPPQPRPQVQQGTSAQQQVQRVPQPRPTQSAPDGAQQQVQHVPQPMRQAAPVDGAQQQVQHVPQRSAAPVDDRDQEVVFDGMGDGIDGVDDVEATVDDGEHEAGDGLADDLEDEAGGTTEDVVDWNDPEAMCGDDGGLDDDEAE